VGNVYPSGFLPIHAGNVKETPLQEIYRNAPIFKSLRDTSKLEGKCGACEYKEICGGASRARAGLKYALTYGAIRWRRSLEESKGISIDICCIYSAEELGSGGWRHDLAGEPEAEDFRLKKLIRGCAIMNETLEDASL
jgi:radical SAM protein with 4Fe4S-binding SPASM domain